MAAREERMVRRGWGVEVEGDGDEDGGTGAKRRSSCIGRWGRRGCGSGLAVVKLGDG